MGQKSRIVSFTLVACLSIFTSGCDHTKPSPGNFKAALQTYFDQNPQCLDSGIKSFPFEADYDMKGQYLGVMGVLVDRFSALKEAGILTTQESVKSVPNWYGHGSTDQKVVIYSIPPASQTLWRSKGDGGMFACYGHVHVKSVDNYTEPADMLGQTTSTVSYTYTVKQVSSWVNNAAVQAVFPELKNEVDGSDKQTSILMVLTHNGWQPDRH